MLLSQIFVKTFITHLPNFSNAGYCLEPMDGEQGLESSVRPTGNLTINDETSYLTITVLPIGEGQSDIPSVERQFNRPVNVRGVVITLRSPESTSATGQPETGTTTPQPAAQQRPINVTLTFLTKKPGDEDFSPLTDSSTNLPKVRGSNASNFALLLSRFLFPLTF